jgi:hypothetical protein
VLHGAMVNPRELALWRCAETEGGCMFTSINL